MAGECESVPSGLPEFRGTEGSPLEVGLGPELQAESVPGISNEDEAACEASDDDLQENAARAGIEIAEEGGIEHDETPFTNVER